MPSTSSKQHNFMAAIAHSPSFAKKVGVSQSVGSDFVKADKGHKFAKGGDMAKKIPPFMGKETKSEERKEMKVSPAMYRKGEKAEGIHGKSGMDKPSKYAKGGFTRAADGVAQKGKTKAQRFAEGGDAVDPNTTVGPPPDRLYQSVPGGDPMVQRGALAATSPVMGGKADHDARKAAREAERNARHPENASRRAEHEARQAEREAARTARRAAGPAFGPPSNGTGANVPNFLLGGNSIKPQKTTTPIAPIIPQPANYVAPTGSKPNGLFGSVKPKAYASGGCVSSKPTKMARGGGCEIKGKTKGRYI